jgi:Cu(I)/Ag(I) efflux system protein CusF
MTLPFSAALQLALVLACVPAITLTVLAAQIAPPASVDPKSSAMKYESVFSSAPVSQAQKLIPGKDASIVIAAASEATGHKEHSAPAVPGTKTAAAGLIPAKGVILQVDQAKATVEIDHDPIPALGWPSMTMPFRLKESALAAQVKQGDTVDFFLEKSGSDYVIVKFGKPVPTKRPH